MYRMKCRHNEGRAGLTLIEVMLAAAVLTIVTGAIFASMIRSQNAYNQGVSQLRIQEESNRIMGEIVEFIRDSKVVSVSDNGCVITLQKPVDYDGDGDVINPNWEVEYGYNWGGTEYLDATCQIVFEMTGNASEIGLSSDLNKDGDMADVYSSGVLYKRFYDSNGVLQQEIGFSGELIFVGDVDGNGTVEPMFQRVDHGGFIQADGKCILAMFLVMNVAPDGFPHVLNLATIITPRNQ